MAQTGSAQREPSMEEILASIRRIIEDGDAAHADSPPVRPDNDVAPAPSAIAPPVAAPPLPAVELSAMPPAPQPSAEVVSQHLPDMAAASPPPAARVEGAAQVAGSASIAPSGAVDRSSATVIEVEAFRAELRAGQPVVEARQEPRKPISLAEVQAQVAADQVAARSAAERDYHGQDKQPAPVDRREAKPASPVATVPAVPEVRDWRLGVPEPAVEPPSPVARQRKEAIAAVFDDIAARQVAAPAAEKVSRPLDVPPEPPTLRQAIISEQAGKQVAAAFGELSDAFAIRSKKSFEDMAEEMLRPLLQDWLDNNLPLLVERLVREEIERVARGS